MKYRIKNGWLDTGDALWAHYENGNQTGLVIARPSQSQIIYHARFYPQNKTGKDINLFSSRTLKRAKQRAERLLPKLRKT